MNARRSLATCRVALALITTSPLAAVTIQVTSTDDDVAVNGNCTLREAISAAGNDLAYDACPAGSPDELDVVEVPAGSYVWSGTHNVSGGRFLVRGPAADPPAAIVSLGSVGRFLRIYNQAEVTLENLELRGGSAMLDGQNPHGGQVAADGADLTLAGMRFVGGLGKGGGALFYRGGAGESLRVERSRFESNVAQSGDPGPVQGGAAEIRLLGDSAAAIVDCEWLDAVATGTSPNAWPYGGALYVETTGGDTVEVARSRFDGNRTTAFGGGLSSGGAFVLRAFGAGDVRLTDLRFTANEVAVPANGFRAAALEVDAQLGGAVLLDRLVFLGNGEGDPGSHLRLGTIDTSSIVATNLLLARGPDTGLEIVAQQDSSIRLGHVTAGAHAGIGVHLVAAQDATIRLDNSVAWGSSIDLWDTVPSSIDPSTLPQGIDPLFVDASADDYRLAPGSPAIDFGDDALATMRPFDAAHGGRVVGEATDAGALEHGALFADDFETGDGSAWSPPAP